MLYSLTNIRLEDIVKQYTNSNFIDRRNHTHTEIIKYKTDTELLVRSKNTQQLELYLDILKLEVEIS